MDQIEADTGRIIDKLESWIEGSVRLVPNLIAALAILLLFYLLGRLLARWARHAAGWPVAHTCQRSASFRPSTPCCVRTSSTRRR